jgi:general L-amino acid transport system permease protein
MTGNSSATDHHARVPPWRDVRVLRVVGQLIIVGLVAVLVAYLVGNLFDNMARSRLTFGLGFLNSRAGFEIAEKPIPYAATDTYGRAFTVGLLNTLMVSIVGIVLATIVGVLTGIARLSSNWLLNKIASGYVEVMRNTPLLVQLVLLYAVFLQLPSVANSIQLPGSVFLNQRGVIMPRPLTEPTFGPWLAIIALGLAGWFGLRWLAGRRAAAGGSPAGLRRIGLIVGLAAPVVGWLVVGQPPLIFDVPELQRFNFRGGLIISPPFMALLLGLVLYTGAFIGEVVRGGIQAVRRGQVEAAQSLGLSGRQILRMVVFPQALRIIVPPLTSQYLNLVKNSSLAIAIGYPDLFAVSTTMSNQTGQPVSVIALVMATYLAISLVTSLLMNLYNRRVQVLEA